ncbi:MAG: phage baseplate assembly protein [Candidatus Thorarchaeota archaeon]
MAKPKPIPGTHYTVIKGDRLWTIAKRAYGNGTKWKVIWEANQTVLRSGNPNMIYPDEVIFIPGDAPIEAIKEDSREDVIPTIEDRDRNDFTLVIKSEELAVSAGRVMRTMDTAADGWTASLAWNPVIADRVELFRPYAYHPAEVYLGGKLMVRGYLYVVSPSLNPTRREMKLEGWSFTADAIDSTLKPPYKRNNITLKQRAEELVRPLGIDVQFDIDDDKPFKRVTAGKEDTIFEHLAGLAKQRGVLISSTVQGKMLFTRAASGTPQVALFEDFPPFQNIAAKFDGRARFNVYKAVGQSPKKNSKTAVAKDDRVPKSRFTTFSADDTEGDDIQKAADWRRSKQIADALTIPFPTSSWYNANGELWRENTLVSVISPSIFCPNGFDFLIRSVEYLFEPGGTSAILNLVPPQTFTGEVVDEPWAEEQLIEEL